jgi:hypothetical protein
MTISSSLLHTPLPPPVAADALEPAARGHVESGHESAPLIATGDSPRASGDSALAQNYGKALLGFTGVPTNDNAILVDIPPDSTFGQWWKLLGEASQSPEFLDWRRHARALPGSIKILPQSGQVTYRVTPDVSLDAPLQMRASEDKHWSAVRGPLMDAGRVISGRNRPFPLPSLESANRAPAWLVGQFYQEPTRIVPSELQQRAAELERDKTFASLDPAVFPGLHEARSEDALNNQKMLLGNTHNQREAALLFKQLNSALASGGLDASKIPEYLRETTFTVHPDSSYPRAKAQPEGATASLQDFLEYHDVDIPGTAKDVANLTTFLQTPAPRSPAHGNYGGALSWPQPLDKDRQRQLSQFLVNGEVGNLNLDVNRSALGYLMQGEQIDASELSDPRQLLDRLIKSPKGRALGEAIQAKFDALSVKGTAEDWLLTALSLHPKDRASRTKQAERSSVAGFQLVGPSNFGRSSQEILRRFTDHLVETGEAPSHDKAKIQAHLLLSTRAPELLVKGIPEKMPFGSHSWVSFSVAVQRLEAKAPGSTASMNYQDVMLSADIAPISDEERDTEYRAQEHAIKEWGFAEGHGYPTDEASIKKVRDAYDARIHELKAASEAQNMQMPVADDIALNQLKTAMPDMDPALFEKKSITLEPPLPDYPGPYSILDLYRSGKTKFSQRPVQGGSVGLLGTGAPKLVESTLVSSDPQIKMPEVLATIRKLPHLLQTFKEAFSTYADSMEKNIATRVKHLISTQPIDVRHDFEFGKVTVMREDKLEWRTTQAARSPTILPRTDNNLLVRTELQGQTRTYEVDVINGKITERLDLKNIALGRYPEDKRFPENQLVEVKPEEEYSAETLSEQRKLPLMPGSYDSFKTAYIADAFVNHFDIKGLKTQAQGLTTFDTELEFERSVAKFFVDMIPLRSAIENFHKGNVGEGLADLAFDVFGFAVGLGVAAKGAKALATGASALNKTYHVAKIVGRAAIGSLNPLDGVGDIARAVGKRTVQLAGKGVKSLENFAGNRFPLLFSKNLDNVSVGTFKLNNQTLEGPAIFSNNKWYAVNPATRQPYGPALIDFIPSASPGRPALKPIKINPKATPDEVQAIADKLQTVTDVGGDKRNVYSGLVFRGDTRPPFSSTGPGVFETGFELRTPINDIREVNGTRGGFGGGHDALDPDGKGISTSAFYNKSGAGAYFYGGHKGGHTYVVDGRNMEGFHLYANRHAIEHPGGNPVKLLPWEINYGTSIPGHRIIGAFDSTGKFIPNPNYAAV